MLTNDVVQGTEFLAEAGAATKASVAFPLEELAKAIKITEANVTDFRLILTALLLLSEKTYKALAEKPPNFTIALIRQPTPANQLDIQVDYYQFNITTALKPTEQTFLDLAS